MKWSFRLYLPQNNIVGIWPMAHNMGSWPNVQRSLAHGLSLGLKALGWPLGFIRPKGHWPVANIHDQQVK